MGAENPIHRDRDKRGKGAQSFKDNKEALNQNEAEIARNAGIPGEKGDGLNDEQRDELFRQAANERLAKVQQEMDDESTS
jgi:hypothetical protein